MLVLTDGAKQKVKTSDTGSQFSMATATAWPRECGLCSSTVARFALRLVATTAALATGTMRMTASGARARKSSQLRTPRPTTQADGKNQFAMSRAPKNRIVRVHSNQRLGRPTE
eukprot:5575537-Prymnesium_polylepis.3